jgi:hypothetical protein
MLHKDTSILNEHVLNGGGGVFSEDSIQFV